MRTGLVSFLLILTWAGIASAACTLPDGVEGEIIYNKEWKITQFCDGEKWRSMDASRGGGGGAAPSGAVMAFDLNDCPSGWSEYVLAYGRFLRGIDKSGTSIDPDGERAAGHLQADAFASHTHNIRTQATSSTDGSGYAQTGNASVNDYSYPTTATGGSETRPKNVALLYCRKD